MDHDAKKAVQILKRLRAAVGYHELGMTRHALECLDSLAKLGKTEAFGIVEDILRGEFQRGTAGNFSAVSALEIASCMLPRPARRAIRMTLAACYGESNAAPRDRKNATLVEMA